LKYHNKIDIERDMHVAIRAAESVEIGKELPRKSYMIMGN